jgi:glycosyltransferase involved in cell wall biosynthesis
MTMGTWGFKTAEAIQKKGIEVVVLSPNPWIPRLIAFTKKTKGYSAIPHKKQTKDILVYYPKCPHYPHRILRNYPYKYLPFFDSYLVWIWCKKTVEEIMQEYPFQVIHSNFLLPNGYIGYKIKQRYGTPHVFQEHSTNNLKFLKNSILYKRLYSKILGEADSIITMNHKMAESINEIKPRENEIKILRCAADIVATNILTQKKPIEYENKNIILSVGALNPKKGHEYLIRAVDRVKKEVSNIQCIIIGRGSQLRNLKKLVHKLSLDEIVEFWGQLPHNDVLKVMSWCDVFVLPAWDESFGTVYSEAMAYGKPIIACDGEGISEVVQNGVQGLLVKKQDVTSLSRALIKILTDEDMANSFGIEAKKVAEKKLNYDIISNEIIELYRAVIS